MKLDNGIEIDFKINHYPGYGSAEAWEILVISNNKLLFKQEHIHSEYELGEKQTNLEMHFNKMEKFELEELRKNSLPASPLCYHCNQPTWEYGGIYINNVIFCDNCSEFIEKYKEELKKERNAIIEKERLEYKNKLLENSNKVKQLTQGYQRADCWYFNKTERLGEVRISKISRRTYPQYEKYVQEALYYLEEDFTILADDLIHIASFYSKND